MIRPASWKILLSALALLVLLVLVPAAVYSSPYWIHVLIICVLNIGMAASVRLIFLAGEISACHAAFMAIGAYTSALLVKNLGFSSWLGLPLGGIAAALIGLSIGYATLKAKGIYFILTTLAFGEVVRLIISNWGLLGAVNGLSNIPRPNPILGIQFVGHLPYYYFVFFLTLITLGICYRIEKSRYGLILRSIAQAPPITESIGINIMSYKVLAFVIACFFAGAFGSFYAHYTTVIHPDMFTLWQSIMLLIYFQVGGVGSIWGAIMGGGFLTIAAEFLRATKHLEVVSFAVLLIFIVLFMPEGLIALPSKVNSLYSWWRKKGSMGKKEMGRDIA
jgi:branched-chain amino acid transport system permease protein